MVHPPVYLGLACCGIVRSKDKQILISKRKPELSYPDAWVFPGGKLDHGESLLQAAKREVMEEVGIDLSPILTESQPVFMYDVFNGPSKAGNFSHFLIFYYLFDISLDASEIKVVIQQEEVAEYKWISVQELKNVVQRGVELIQKGDTYGGEGELEGLHPNKNGVGIAEGSFQGLKAIYDNF